jgi:uroporphyrin-III C-methyltransferase
MEEPPDVWGHGMGIVGAGSLTVVGTGFGGGGQLTADAGDAIASSEMVLYLVPDPSTEALIRAANPTAESLGGFYAGRPSRLATYLAMTEYVLSFVRRGLKVCAAFYGHPGVFVFPSHEAVIRAREEGFAARMLPAVSAEDCLFADVGVDPGRRGCLTLDATDFLVRGLLPDVTVALILWQAGAVGRVDYPGDDNRDNITILAEVLTAHYGPRHRIVIYEAPSVASSDPVITFVYLEDLAQTPIRLISTLYIPPRDEPVFDEAMAARLGLPEDFRRNGKDAASRYDPSRPYGEPHARLYGR